MKINIIAVYNNLLSLDRYNASLEAQKATSKAFKSKSKSMSYLNIKRAKKGVL